MLVDLLRPGGPELVRRWVAALLLAPAGERERIVGEVERRLVELYAESLAPSPARESSAPDDPQTVHVVTAPVQREGYVEVVERSYSQAKKPPAKAKTKASTRREKRA